MKASTLPISGLRAPARTAAPTSDFAMLTRLRESRLPPLTRSSMSVAEPMTTSVISPASMRLRMSAIPAHCVSTFSLLWRWNAGTSSPYAPRIASEAMTFMRRSSP